MYYAATIFLVTSMHAIICPAYKMFASICCRGEEKGHVAYSVITMHMELLLDYEESYYFAMACMPVGAY